MKKFLLAATAAAMLSSTPAFAQASDTDDFDINANVAEACTMENIADIDLGTLSINTTAGSNALYINGPAANTTGTFWLSCNESNRMTLVPTAGVLENTTRSVQPGDDAGFKDEINYSVAALNYRNGLLQPAYNSLLGPVFQNLTRGAIHRQVNIGAAVTALENLDGRPLAGTYTDTVTVTVTTI